MIFPNNSYFLPILSQWLDLMLSIFVVWRIGSLQSFEWVTWMMRVAIATLSYLTDAGTAWRNICRLVTVGNRCRKWLRPIELYEYE